jgi:hypothetical protein
MKKDDMKWQVARVERSVYKNLVAKHEGKSSSGRPRHSWNDDNEMDLNDIGLYLIRLPRRMDQ